MIYGLPQNVNESACVVLSDVFTAEEISRITQLRGIPQKATTDDKNEKARNSTIAWLNMDNAPWLFDKLGEVVKQTNAHYFQFDLLGFYEPLQYTSYKVGEFYDWHMDKGPDTVAPRKLSMTLQLSAPEDYVGGEFEIQAGSNLERCPREKGSVIFFPSWVLHRVTPVTEGVRRSLVVWVHGPAFR